MILEQEYRSEFGSLNVPRHTIEIAIEPRKLKDVPTLVTLDDAYMVNWIDFHLFPSLPAAAKKNINPIFLYGLLNFLEEDDNPVFDSIWGPLDGYSNPQIWDSHFLIAWGQYSKEQYELFSKTAFALEGHFVSWEFQRIIDCLGYLTINAELIDAGK